MRVRLALRWLVAALALLPATVQAVSPLPQKSLKLWHAYRGEEEKALEQSVRLFTQKTSVPVEVLALPYDVFASKLIAAIPHDVGPDVFIYAHERVPLFESMGMVAPTDGLVEPTAYFASAIDALRLGGKIYGYPMSLKFLVLYRNTRLVPQAPATTRELLSVLPTLSSERENRFGLAYESGNFYYHAPFLFGFGGKLFAEDGHAVFDTPEMARSLAFVKELQDRRYIPEEASGALVKSLFNDGRAAMVISGPWFAGEVSPEISYVVTPLPRVSETGLPAAQLAGRHGAEDGTSRDLAPGLPMRPFLGVEAALVSARSKNPKEAQKLARFLSLGEAAVVRATVGRQIPANLSAYDEPSIRRDSYISAFRRAGPSTTPMPTTFEMTRVWEPMKMALRAVLQGGVSPQEAGALAERRYRALNRPRPPLAKPWPYLLFMLAAVFFLGFWIWNRSASDRSRWQAGSRGTSRPYRQSSANYLSRWQLGRVLLYLAPAAAGIFVLVIVPFAFCIGLSLFHHEGGKYSFVGLANFIDIFVSRGYRISEPLSFYYTLVVTFLWTVINVTLHVGIGLALAILLKDPLLRFRGVYRALLILPWAIPNYITAILWKGMFHRQFGAVNGLLQALHLEPVSWFAHFSTAFAANVVTNTWLGFPFMMVVALGALQSIPSELYDAAEVDGASGWQQFKRITLPLLKPALLPAVILGSVWTFNMFNIICLVSNGEPGGSTDILVSEAYRWAFERNEQYGFAAAYSVLIFLVLLGWSTLTRRVSLTAQEAAS